MLKTDLKKKLSSGKFMFRKALLKSFCHSELMVEYLSSIDKEIRYHPRAKGEVTHYCADCEV